MENNDFISKIVVFKPSQGSVEFEIILDGEHDTVWVSEQQLTESTNMEMASVSKQFTALAKMPLGKS